MPITKSAAKAAKQSNKRRMQRQPVKTLMKTMLKKFADATKQGKKEEALKLLPQVYKSIDMAAKKHLLHTNNADRKKSLVARTIANMK